MTTNLNNNPLEFLVDQLKNNPMNPFLDKTHNFIKNIYCYDKKIDFSKIGIDAGLFLVNLRKEQKKAWIDGQKHANEVMAAFGRVHNPATVLFVGTPAVSKVVAKRKPLDPVSIKYTGVSSLAVVGVSALYALHQHFLLKAEKSLKD